MDQATLPIIVALISAATTSLGWFVLHDLTHKRETKARKSIAQMADRTRRLELRLKYHEQQIREFYAPLYSNIQLIWNIRAIRERLIEKLPENDDRVRRVLEIKYYLPLHTEIREIIKTKIFLIDGVEMLKSFSLYLEHSVMQDVKIRLSEEDGINTSSVQGFPWPDEFPKDVQAGLDKAMRSYDEIIQELARSAAVASSGEPATTYQPRRVSPGEADQKLAGEVVQKS